MTVTALLVSHGGARWLPAVLEGLAAQTHPPDHCVAVDTGSKDESADLVRAAFGADALATAPRGTGFGAAVDLALAKAPDSDWVWLLHDDANPAPTALAELLAAASADRRADILGPKLREWPSLRRLLEVGITISGTGRRETGLERGEYDQGQHDEVRQVLAVNTAGMLVRRSVLDELGGFDRQLPVFGNDLDFGWRAALAGHRTIVVPRAVVFHAEAAHRGTRRTPLTGRHTHYQERRAALYTLLANGRGRSLPFRTVRLAFGTLLRAIGFLLVRAVGPALDELAALGSIYARPGQIRQARRARAPLRTADPDTVRPLLPPWWLPYRHGLDFASDLVSAAVYQAQDVAERRRAASLAAAPPVTAGRRGHSSGRSPGHSSGEEEDELAEDSGIVARFLTNPVAVALTVFVALALVGARTAFGDVGGGALSPAPAGAMDWWTLYGEHWHPLGTGTDVAAPAYLVPLALLATLLAGSAPTALSAVLVLAVPVALWGAWRFLRVAGRLVSADGVSRWILAAGAGGYALVPVTSGAWGGGRLGTVVAATVLPWLAHAALGFADPESDRRWRAAWRTGLLLAVCAAFAPAVWIFAALLAVVVLVAGALLAGRAIRRPSVWGPPLTALAVVPVLLLPWWLTLVSQGAAEGLLVEAGRLPSVALGFTDLLLGRAESGAAPVVIGGAVVTLAVLALLPRGSRILVLLCWLAALVAAGTAALLAPISVPLAATEFQPGLGSLVVVLQGAWITAVVVAAQEAIRSRRWRVLGVAGALALALVPVLGMAWFVVGSDLAAAGLDETGLEEMGLDMHDPRLDEPRGTDIPAYMVQSSALGEAHGILILEGTVDEGVTYSIRRGDGPTTGEDEIEALTPEDAGFTAGVQALVSRPTTAVVDGLADQGIEYVLLRAPADGRIAATLDAAAGLAQASTEDRAARAWQVEQELNPAALSGPSSWLRTALLVLQGVAVVVVLVLAGPTLRGTRDRGER